MIMKENVPQAVLDVANDLIKRYGESFKYLGLYKGHDAYMFQFPRNSFTGFPFVYLYDADKNIAVELTGEMALNILSFLN